jgi:hypothetical protein
MATNRVVFGRIRNGTLFYEGDTLYRKEPRQGSFGENAQSVDNPRFWEFFNDSDMVEAEQSETPPLPVTPAEGTI